MGRGKKVYEVETDIYNLKKNYNYMDCNEYMFPVNVQWKTLDVLGKFASWT